MSSRNRVTKNKEQNIECSFKCGECSKFVALLAALVCILLALAKNDGSYPNYYGNFYGLYVASVSLMLGIVAFIRAHYFRRNGSCCTGDSKQEMCCDNISKALCLLATSLLVVAVLLPMLPMSFR